MPLAGAAPRLLAQIRKWVDDKVRPAGCRPPFGSSCLRRRPQAATAWRYPRASPAGPLRMSSRSIVRPKNGKPFSEVVSHSELSTSNDRRRQNSHANELQIDCARVPRHAHAAQALGCLRGLSRECDYHWLGKEHGTTAGYRERERRR